jgi:hypothetical protein
MKSSAKWTVRGFAAFLAAAGCVAVGAQMAQPTADPRIPTIICTTDTGRLLLQWPDMIVEATGIMCTRTQTAKLTDKRHGALQ